MFEGPVERAAGACAGSGGFNELAAGIRRLLLLDDETFALIAAVEQVVQSYNGHLLTADAKIFGECFEVHDGGQRKRGDVPPPRYCKQRGPWTSRGSSNPPTKTPPIQWSQH
jgi:hypothetical protein